MQKLIAIVLAGIMSTAIAFADETATPLEIYPLDVKVRVYPEEIRYGDPCFLTFSVTNQGTETIQLPRAEKASYGNSVLLSTGIGLYHKEKRIFAYGSNFLTKRETSAIVDYAPFRYSWHPVKPGEIMICHYYLAWFPLPELENDENSKELLQLVNQSVNEYKILGPSYPFDDRFVTILVQTDSPDGTTYSRSRLENKGYRIDPNPEKLECSIRILPRSEAELKLVQDWYLEIPSTVTFRLWIMEHVFAHPHYVRDAPDRVGASSMTPEELKKDNSLDWYRLLFLKSMATRTPAVLERIERTNGLAAKILERSKQPGSTISQNLVEFIQLRGFLVDMRYAENEEAEKEAFEKLIGFVEKAKDKDHWIKFLDEIGFYSMRCDTTGDGRTLKPFSSLKAESYRKLFGEHFSVNVLQ